MSKTFATKSFGKPAAAIAAFCVALVVVLWAATAERVAFERAEDLRNATSDLSKLAIAYEEHTLATLKDVDQLLSLIKDQYERNGPNVDIARLVRAGHFDQALFTNISIVDREGWLVSGIVPLPPSRVSFADRDYFLAQRESDSGNVVIGVPVRGRVTGKWTTVISRRLNRRDGSFDGIVFVAVDPAYFASFYRRIDLGPHGVVMLLGLDGVARVRQVGDETTFGQDMSGATLFKELKKARAGSFVSVGKLDGINRLYSYRALADYPVIVSLGEDVATLRKPSEERSRMYYLAAVLITAFIVVSGAMIASLLGRHARALRTLRESEERFRALVEQNISGIYVLQDGVIKYVNPRCAEIGGYEPQDLIGRSVLDFVPEPWRETLQKQMQERTTGATRTAQYTLTGRRKDGSPVEVGIHATRAIYDGRPAILGVMQDVSERKVAEQVAQRHLVQLEGALVGAIEALSSMVELRDPYTAGHQRQVGEIAAAIGTELGLPETQIKGLRFAAYVHDIGKIAIPAEILSKPGKLTSHEFELIKTHPQQGYDVLKGIAFPWPIARAILEHHERIDGSGYPHGLKGEQISLEARILAVADTLEAMSSHRPYRAALGLESAMREIQEQSGKRYDGRVVAAALRLLRAGSLKLAA